MIRRSSGSEVARRLNLAYGLIQAQALPRQVLAQLVGRYGLSRRQAYRYLRQARQVQEPVPVPEAQEVLSVKLPRRLLAQVRRQAQQQGCTLKGWVDQALQGALPPEEDYG